MAKKVNDRLSNFINTIPKNSRYKVGDFRPYNPKKYGGDLNKPIGYRSSYELKFMKRLEINPTVKIWNCENIIIQYLIKENGIVRTRDYIMDFEVISKSGTKYIIEVKPDSKVPKTKKEIMRNPENYKNSCKWKASILWAKRYGYKFCIVSEKELERILNF